MTGLLDKRQRELAGLIRFGVAGARHLARLGYRELATAYRATARRQVAELRALRKATPLKPGEGFPTWQEIERRERAADDIRRKPNPCRPVRVFDAGRWDPVQGRVVPDTVGTLVYPADYAYDPMRGDR